MCKQFQNCPVSPMTDGVCNPNKSGDHCSKMHPRLLHRISEDEEMVSFAILIIPESNFLMNQSLCHCILNVRKIKMFSSVRHSIAQRLLLAVLL